MTFLNFEKKFMKFSKTHLHTLLQYITAFKILQKNK